MPHPAILRGRYDVQPYCSARIGARGDVRRLPSARFLVRAVDFDDDMQARLMEARPLAEDGDSFDADEMIEMLAPVLRDGLLDPGNGRKVNRLAPINLILKGARLASLGTARDS